MGGYCPGIVQVDFVRGIMSSYSYTTITICNTLTQHPNVCYLLEHWVIIYQRVYFKDIIWGIGVGIFSVYSVVGDIVMSLNKNQFKL